MKDRPVQAAPADGLQAVRMREKEEAVLKQLGLSRTVSYTAEE